MTSSMTGLSTRALPQMSGAPFLTDGGMETSLIFHDGMELPLFAAFTLLRTDDGRALLRRYYRRYLDIARANGVGFILEAPTWRASPDWGGKLGYSEDELAAANREAIRMMLELRSEYQSARLPIVVSGNIGPRGDGYDPGEVMTADEAQSYHSRQISIFGNTDADLITAMTLTNVPEAIGIARAAAACDMPVVLSFTLETDGRLPTGQSLREAIETVDERTSSAPAYYMINCAHPSHFEGVVAGEGNWRNRVRAIRANASRRSHAELDEAEDLDDGNPKELGEEYARLCTLLPNLNIFGGCCGTDHRHVTAIARSCLN